MIGSAKRHLDEETRKQSNAAGQYTDEIKQKTGPGFNALGLSA